MSSKTVSPPGFIDEVFWVGMVDIMLPVQFYYYSNSNRFSSQSWLKSNESNNKMWVYQTS